ncbi:MULTISPECIES: hypothetical protein [Xenorhabdus]|nr:hypothetical protein [Xenorhabdus khoisanae]
MAVPDSTLLAGRILVGYEQRAGVNATFWLELLFSIIEFTQDTFRQAL